MSFFPTDPEIPEPDDDMESSQPRWWGPPDNELPAFFPVSEIVAATVHAAIALVGVAVHSEGLEFRLERRLRRHELAKDDWNRLCAAFMEHHAWGGPAVNADRLRFGLVLGDGEQVLADRSPFGEDPISEPGGHVLNRRGGGAGGGGRSFSGTDELWLWPLPPAGPIELVVQWPALGIGEEHILLDGTAITALASRARPIWP